MPKVYYYGRKTNLVGKTLFEILANLRDFGLNRMVIKNRELLWNPGHKCYYIVKKVEPVMDEKLQEGAIYAERVFRGVKEPELAFIDDETWHTDWQLIPRDEEHKYMLKEGEVPNIEPVQPKRMPVPPLMDIFLKRQNKSMNIDIVLPDVILK